LFFGGRKIEINDQEMQRFDLLKIANTKIKGGNSKEYFGRHPSLFFHFNCLESATTEEELIRLLIDLINVQFHRH